MLTSLTIAVIADVHVGMIKDEFQRAVELCNQLPLGFVVLLGDFTEPPSKENTDRFIADLHRLRKPFYIVAGNMETIPEAQEYGTDILRTIQDTFPGPWGNSLTYRFDLDGWRFIVLGGIRHVPVDIHHFYINGYKGLVNRTSHVMTLDETHREHFMEMLDASGSQPTCVIMHVAVAPLTDRLHEAGAVDQSRLIEVQQLRSIIEARKNVHIVLSAHHHLNQVSVLHHQLHCITQSLRGRKSLNDTPAIRLLELTDTELRGKLVWDDGRSEPIGEIGSMQGDKSFAWNIPR